MRTIEEHTDRDASKPTRETSWPDCEDWCSLRILNAQCDFFYRGKKMYWWISLFWSKRNSIMSSFPLQTWIDRVFNCVLFINKHIIQYKYSICFYHVNSRGLESLNKSSWIRSRYQLSIRARSNPLCDVMTFTTLKTDHFYIVVV